MIVQSPSVILFNLQEFLEGGDNFDPSHDIPQLDSDKVVRVSAIRGSDFAFLDVAKNPAVQLGESYTVQFEKCSPIIATVTYEVYCNEGILEYRPNRVEFSCYRDGSSSRGLKNALSECIIPNREMDYNLVSEANEMRDLSYLKYV